MRWQNKSSRPIIFDFINAKDIVNDAYNEGYIDWNVYQKAIARINTNMNGSWMFENKEKAKVD